MDRTQTFLVEPIGWVRGSRTRPVDDGWDAERADVELDATKFGPEALLGLGEFSHVEIVFCLDKVDAVAAETGARRPRGNPSWPEVGIFAQRAKARPNRLAVTVCRLTGVDGLRLRLEGLDAIDGSPVLDIKPWVREFGPRGETRQPAWITELMRAYW